MTDMIFKTDRQAAEWDEVVAGKHGDLMAPVIAYTNAASIAVAKRPAVITGIHRTSEEQTAIIVTINKQLAAAGRPLLPLDRKSVHQYWRGFDVRYWIYTPGQAAEIVRRVNAAFRYGKGRLKVLAIHHHGTAAHLHGQVPWQASWTPAGD